MQAGGVFDAGRALADHHQGGAHTSSARSPAGFMSSHPLGICRVLPGPRENVPRARCRGVPEPAGDDATAGAVCRGLPF